MAERPYPFTFLRSGHGFSAGIRQLATRCHPSDAAQRHQRRFMPAHGSPALQAMPAISASRYI